MEADFRFVMASTPTPAPPRSINQRLCNPLSGTHVAGVGVSRPRHWESTHSRCSCFGGGHACSHCQPPFLCQGMAAPVHVTPPGGCAACHCVPQPTRNRFYRVPSPSWQHRLQGKGGGRRGGGGCCRKGLPFLPPCHPLSQVNASFAVCMDVEHAVEVWCIRYNMSALCTCRGSGKCRSCGP